MQVTAVAAAVNRKPASLYRPCRAPTAKASSYTAWLFPSNILVLRCLDGETGGRWGGRHATGPAVTRKAKQDHRWVMPKQ
jgi:hypothetical protein